MLLVRTSFVVIAALVLALFPSNAGAQQATLRQRVDAYIRPWADSGQFSGVILIAKGDRLLMRQAYGTARANKPMRTEAVFPLASLSKSYTASAIVDLERKKRLSFSDPLARFLPDFPNASNITIDQLLRHQSGIGVIENPEFYLTPHPIDAYVREIAGAKPLFSPGKGDEYSNEGYILLAAVVQRVSGVPLITYLHDHELAPLMLVRTRWDLATPLRPAGRRAMFNSRPQLIDKDESPLPGASGLQSNADEIWRWMRALKDKEWGDYSALSYPYGWGRRNYQGRTLVEQSGSVEGFGSYMAAYDDGYFVIVLSNVQSGMQGRWGEDLAQIMFGTGEGSRPPVFVVKPDAHPLSDYQGDFTNPSGGYPLRLCVRSGHLSMTWGNYPFWRPVSVLGPDDLIAMADYTRMHIERDNAGRPARVLLTPLDGSTKDAPKFERATDFGKRASSSASPDPAFCEPIIAGASSKKT